MDPTVAADVAAEGFDSKQAYADYLIRNTGTPGWLFWQTRQQEMQQAREGVEPFASYLKLGEGDVVPVSRFKGEAVMGVPVNPSVNFPRSPTPIEIIVMGGKTNTYWSGGDFSYATSASIDKWR
jgi:hypothetical protein